MPLLLIQPMNLVTKIKFEEAPGEFGRVAAQSAKQTIMEKMRKQTRAITYNTYKEHEQEIMSGTVDALIIVSSMSTLAASKPNCQNKTKSLEKCLLPTTVSKYMSTRLKTTLVVSTSLLAVAILK